MDRRKFLTVAGATTFAGCGGKLGESNGDANATTTEQIEAAEDGPPYFEQVEISGPETVEVNESFPLTVSVANTGGRSGDFTATLSLGEGAFSSDTSVEITDVEKGTRKSTEIGPASFEQAGEYTFKITDYAASHTVAVEPLDKAFGESATVADDLRLTPQEIEIKRVLDYRENDEQHFYTPDDGNVFVFIHVTVENPTSESKRLSTRYLDIGAETFTAEFGENSYSLPDFPGIDGQPYQGEIAAGDQSRYWLLAEVSREDVEGAFELTAQRDGADTTPEVVWTDEPEAGTREFPEFELVSFDLPAAAEIGTEFEAEVTVKNTGQAAGSFIGAFYQRNAIGDSQEQWFRDKISLDSIEPGATRSYSTTFSEPFLGSSIYTVKPFGDEQEIDFQPATRQFGSSYETPYGVEVSISQLEEGRELRLDRGYDDTIDAPSGEKFVVAHIQTKNTADRHQTPPEIGELSVETGSGTYDAREVDTTFSDIEYPADGPYYRSGLGLSPGESKSGWLTFSVPSNVPLDDVAVHWNRQYDDLDIDMTFEATAKWQMDE